MSYLWQIIQSCQHSFFDNISANFKSKLPLGFKLCCCTWLHSGILKGEKAPLGFLMHTFLHSPPVENHSCTWANSLSSRISLLVSWLTFLSGLQRASPALTGDHPIMLIWSFPFSFQGSFCGSSPQEIQFLWCLASPSSNVMHLGQPEPKHYTQAGSIQQAANWRVNE